MIVRLYVVTHLKNGYVYIGITRHTVRRRWGQHVHAASEGPTRFSRAIRKHGRKMFTVRCVETYTTWQEACVAEIALIAEVRALGRQRCYNMSDGGDGIRYSGAELKKHKERMRRQMLKMRKDPSFVRKVRAAAKAAGARDDVLQQRLENTRLINADPRLREQNVARLQKQNKSKKFRAHIKALYADPVFMARVRAERVSRNLIPGYRERQLVQLQKALAKLQEKRASRRRALDETRRAPVATAIAAV